ncbi:uncharacterized protein LOC141590013 [Silene latifolia]|uniref:uncharacterized protein LOC141590013 n=1 Tax=Silene latifolia TaxID=37657 RepID=UPI003D77932A
MLSLASRYSVCRKTITYLWNVAQAQRRRCILVNVNSKKKGSKKIGRVVLDIAKLESIELLKRTTQRSLAENLGVSQSTISRWVTSKQIKSHSNAIKPGLNEKNKLARLLFSLAHLDYHEITKRVVFKDQSNIIHMDEKWFSKTKVSTRFYLSKGETEPHRCVQSKSFIEKVMFMCAVARPKYGSNGDVIFDGKIGIWPFVSQVPAKRNSKNREAETLETKCIESINKQVTRDMVINCVLPAIKAKWPPNLSKHIIIQQDNARPHFTNDDPEFRKAATSDGWKIELAYQTPNSPDLNVLDLGFLGQSNLSNKKKTIKLDELIHNTVTAYEEQDVLKLNYVWITLQTCMLEIMKKKGGIDYPVPHMHKSKLAAAGLLPDYLNANIDLVKECIQYVHNVGDASTISELVNSLSILTKNAAENIASTSGSSNDPTGDIEPVGTITEQVYGSNDPTGDLSPVGNLTASNLD